MHTGRGRRGIPVPPYRGSHGRLWRSPSIGFFSFVPPTLGERWKQMSDQYIALVEPAAVVGAVFYWPSLFRNPDFSWYEDNTVSLGSLAKGGNRLEIDSAITTLHLAFTHLGACGWFAYAQSDSNCADSASRLLHDGPWAPCNGFKPENMTIPEWP